jgi:hypothetical protein
LLHHARACHGTRISHPRHPLLPGNPPGSNPLSILIRTAELYTRTHNRTEQRPTADLSQCSEYQLASAVATFKLTAYQVQVTLRLTVSQSVCLGVEPWLGLMTYFFFCSFHTWKLLSYPFGAPLSDERLGLLFVSHSSY